MTSLKNTYLFTNLTVPKVSLHHLNYFSIDCRGISPRDNSIVSLFAIGEGTVYIIFNELRNGRL